MNGPILASRPRVVPRQTPRLVSCMVRRTFCFGHGSLALLGTTWKISSPPADFPPTSSPFWCFIARSQPLHVRITHLIPLLSPCSSVQGASEAVNGSRALPSFSLLVEFASNVRCSFRLLLTWCFAQRPNNDDGIAEYILLHSADGLHKSEILHLNCAHQLRTCPDVTCLRTGCD